MREDEDASGTAMMTSAAGHKRGSVGSEGMAEQQWRAVEMDSRIPDTSFPVIC